MREGVFKLYQPSAGNDIPLLFDSPHSGDQFPADFTSAAPRDVLLTAWDAYVDDLWSPAVNMGATLLAADFPRVYIDPNRAPDDVDPAIIDGALPFKPKPTVYSGRGMGLIRQFALPNQPMHDRPLTADQVMTRLNDYYLPYHSCLRQQLDTLYAKFGAVWHIDCHSMKSVGNAMNIDAGKYRPDIILGDLDGTSADPAFGDTVIAAFEKLGYTTGRNDPYKGGYVTQAYHAPEEKRHTIQIEINRRVYLDEASFKPNDNYATFKRHLATVAAAVKDYILLELGRG